MHLEDDVCAKCGEEVQDFLKPIRFNRSGPPFFCSVDCYDSVTDPATKQWDREIDRKIEDENRHESIDWDIALATKRWDEEAARKNFNARYHQARTDRDAKEAERLRVHAEREEERERREEEREEEREEKERVKEEAKAAKEKVKLDEEKRRRERLEPVYVDFPDKVRFEHTHILAATGSGKSVFMREMLRKTSFGPEKAGLRVSS